MTPDNPGSDPAGGKPRAGSETAAEPGPAPGAAAEPNAGTGRRRKRRRVVRPGVGGDPVIPARSADDSDVGWHQTAGDSTNDERLRRDVPPHW